MDEDKIYNDEKFRLICQEYGLDITTLCVIGDIISVDYGYNTTMYFDNNYNLFYVADAYSIIDEELLKDKYESYSKIYIAFYEFPFVITVKEVMDLSNRIEDLVFNFDGSILAYINGNEYHIKDTDYIEILSFIKFLSNSIKEYTRTWIHMVKLGLEMPDIPTYLNNLVSTIKESAIDKMENPYSRLIRVYDVLEDIAWQYKKNDEYNNALLSNIIRLCQRLMYYDDSSAIKIPEYKELFDKMNTLLTAIDTPLEEVEIKRKNKIMEYMKEENDRCNESYNKLTARPSLKKKHPTKDNN